MASFKPVGKGAPVSDRADDANREILFAGNNSSAGGGKEGAEEKARHPEKASVASTANVLSEARQNLEQRGEKLNQLADKSDKLANASSEFADMAKQLRKQQQKSSWWG